MSDRELLELAAKAAGMEGYRWHDRRGCLCAYNERHLNWYSDSHGNAVEWNPRDDDGDALRLAVELFDGDDMEVIWYRAKLLLAECPELGRVAATRRAIFHAAAEIGRNMK